MAGIEYYVFDDALRDPAVREVFARAVDEVTAGTATAVKLSRGRGLAVDGHLILHAALIEYALTLVPAADFDAVAARAFSERMRTLFGWNDISSPLRQWVEQRLATPYFTNQGSDWDPDWQLRADADTSGLPDAFFDFACYVAIGELKHGPSYASVSANRIFDWVTKLGSDLPEKLKKHGTGELPAELASFRGTGDAAGVTVTANDALATVRIVVKTEHEASYAAALEVLTQLLERTDFPRSYAVEFRGPSKLYLPARGLPKKGVHQLFACAVAYPALWPAIARYARAAMSEYDWYLTLDDEQCAMPGSFAVFALGLADADAGSDEYTPLVLDYLREVDGEHQSIQSAFVEAVIGARGFDRTSLAMLLTCAGNIQHLTHRKTWPSLIDNADSLDALLALRRAPEAAASGVAALRANLLGEDVDDAAWRHALFAIWGKAAEQRDRAGRTGGKIIDAAPEALRDRYNSIFSQG